MSHAKFHARVTRRLPEVLKFGSSSLRRGSPRTLSMNGGHFTLTCAPRMSEGGGVVNGGLNLRFSLFPQAIVSLMLDTRGTFMSTERPRAVLAFDVYGTLIDPFHMEEHLRAVFGERAKEASEL